MLPVLDRATHHSAPPAVVADGAAALADGWQVTPYAVVAFAATVVAVVFAAATWRSTRKPGTFALTTLALGAAWWAFLYGLELSAGSLAAKLLFGRLSYLGIVVVPISWFAFALAYTGRSYRLTPSTVGALSFPSALAAIFPWTSGSNDLFWATTSLVGGPGTAMALEYGPAFWLWSAYGYALIGVGTVLLLWSVPLDARLFRTQTALLVLGVAAPWFTNLAYLSRVVTLDVTPLGFVGSALVLGAGFRRYRLLDVHPAARAVARDELVERMVEAVVVLDDEDRIVDLNRSAQSLLGVEADDFVGAPLGATAPDLAAAIEGIDDDTTVYTTATPPRHYGLRVSPLRGDRTATVGRLLILRDVTERRRRERRITVLNRVLRHDLSNDVSLIQGYAALLEEDPGNETYPPIIGRTATEVLDLIGTIRRIERTLESGTPTLSEIDVAGEVRDQVELARRAHPGAVIEADLPATERIHATDLVSSAVDNLIENAVEHNDTDRPHVRVSIDREVEEGRAYVAIRVADDGPGIPPADRAVLVGTDDGGLEEAGGLGLWLVNWIVSESGGEVRYDPNDPRGSVVVLRFPAAGSSGGEDDEQPAGDGTDADADAGTGTFHPRPDAAVQMKKTSASTTT